MAMVRFAHVLLGLFSGVAAECMEAGCAGGDDSALLAINAKRETTRALLKKRAGPAIEGWYCKTFSTEVCPAVSGPKYDNSKACKKRVKKNMKQSCKDNFKTLTDDKAGHKTCKKLIKPMKKACKEAVNSKGSFRPEDCRAVLTANYDCVDFCTDFRTGVCPKVSGTVPENKKACKQLKKRGSRACVDVFGESKKKDMAKNADRCQKLMTPMKKQCDSVVKKNKKEGTTDKFDEPMCEEVLFANYACGKGGNPCADKKPTDIPYFDNVPCFNATTGDANSFEQSGINVTQGYNGGFETDGRQPITSTLAEAGLCPVNVHWHLGTEHLSVGQYDEDGTGPPAISLAQEAVRRGFRCNFYNPSDAKFTKAYPWKYCKDVVVGETYEVHWPHSTAGACGTQWQYQSPFYDGVFCYDGILDLSKINEQVGVQAQIFTIVNDDDYSYPNLIRGWIVKDDYGEDIAYYTGSTTGTTRSNEICSRYTPITWQVDRKCHLISASSFDEMCKDMKGMSDDMTYDLKAKGSRELVDYDLAANNLQLVQETDQDEEEEEEEEDEEDQDEDDEEEED